MIKCLVFLAVSLLGIGLMQQGRMVQRTDGIWLSLPANASQWTIEGSTNGSNWFPYLIKTGLGPLKTIELQLNTNETVQMWRLKEETL
jgi:hypothetical protein